MKVKIGRNKQHTLIIDKKDAWILEEYTVAAHAKKNKPVRVRCWPKGIPNKERKTVDISNIILGTPEGGKVVDHKNGNPLDNRRLNLRPATNEQNARNRRPGKTFNGRKQTSKFKGVRLKVNKWYVTIKVNNKQVYVGRFTDEEEAARAYDKKALELHGSFARLNFPRKKLIKRV